MWLSVKKNIRKPGSAGLISLGIGNFGVHLGVWRDQWVWGHEVTWYDGNHHSFGLGPFFMFVWSDW